MATHLLRDYQTQNLANGNRAYIAGYILTIFMRRVLTYSHVGSTNYPINAIGTLLIATGDTNPTGTATFPPGNKAGINLGSQKEFYVSIPSGVRVVAAADIGRILVLRSTTFPTFNSGCFVIVGVEVSTNSYIIDYRTLGDKPPVEAADSIQWWLYEKDFNCPIIGANNTKTSAEYRSDGNSTTPRIILQSPHTLGWQVRICNEAPADFISAPPGSIGNCPQMTAAPGFGGNSAGDFAAFGQHFHAPMWYNTSNTNYVGGAPGFGDGFTGTSGIQHRITIVGDDAGQGIVLYGRRLLNATMPSSFITVFGLAENEPAPLPVNNQARLFCIGTGYMGSDNFGNFGNRYVNDGSLQMGTPQLNPPVSQGMSATAFGTPCICATSFWTYITGVSQAAGPHFDSSGTDNPFTSSTDLLPIDLIQGTLNIWIPVSTLIASVTANPVYPYYPRSIGTIPFIREGRSDFGDFSPTTDAARSWQHLRRGLYIPWNGPNIIP